MKKRIISIIAVLTIVLSVSVSGAGIAYKNDFDNPPESGVVADMEGWKGYDTARTSGASFEDGAVKLERFEEGSASGYALYDVSYNVSATSDFVVMFDVKMVGSTYNFAGWLYMGLQRLSFPSDLDDGMEADKWYTFAMQSVNGENGTQTAKFYRKGPWNNEEEKEACDFEYITSGAGSDRADVPHINIGVNNAPAGGAMLIDNMEVAEGDFLSDVVFKADGVEIEKAEDAQGAERISAEAVIFSGSNLTPELDKTQSFMPVLLLFDSEGRMLDCQMTLENMGKLYNKVETSADISRWSEDISCVQFCIWDSVIDIQPLFDSVELN